MAWQVAATLLTALAGLWFGWKSGGAAVVLGGWIAARIGLGGGVTGAFPAMTRLLAGMLAKWAVLVVLMGAGVVALGLPPLPMLVAAAVALLAQMVAMVRNP